MIETYKRLGAVAPSDNVEQMLYSSPDGAQTLVSNITVTNRSSEAKTFDINVYPDNSVQQSDLDSTITSYRFVSIPVNDTRTAAVSTNGTTWASSTLPSYGSWQASTFGQDFFVSLKRGTEESAVSTDGLTWSHGTVSLSANWTAIAYGNGLFTAVGSSTDGVTQSTDGIVWSTRTLPQSANWSAITYGGDSFVAVTAGNTISAASTDGVTWIQGTLPLAVQWNSVAYGNGIFVSAISNVSAASTDGVTWVRGTMPIPRTWSGISYGNGIFCTVSETLDVSAISTDGLTWVLGTMPPPQEGQTQNFKWRGVAFGDGKFVTTAINGGTTYNSSEASASSTDGLTWSLSTMPSAQPWGSICSGETTYPYSSPRVNSIYRHSSIGANETLMLEPGIIISNSGSIVVKDNSDGYTGLTFSAYGVELT